MIEKQNPVHNSGEELASLSDKQLRNAKKGAMAGSPRWKGVNDELAERQSARQTRLIKLTLGIAFFTLIAACVSAYKAFA